MIQTVEEYVFPLSFQQHRMWFLEQLDPGNSAFHMPIVLRLVGPVRVDVLRDAVQHVVDRHEALRTRYEPDSPVQVVAESWTVPVTLLDLSGLAESRTHELDRIKRDVIRRPFDLWAAPPVRVVVVRLAADEHVLVLVVHHIAGDGWSLGVLAEELSVVYPALREGTRPDLPDLPVQYGDFALWQREQVSGAALAAELAHWSDVLVGAPAALDLPIDRPRPVEPTYDGGRVRLDVPEPVAAQLEALARAHGASLFMVVLAAYSAVLTRMSGVDEVVVGTATAGRSRPEVAGLVGCFIDVVPLRVAVPAGASVGDLLRRVRAVCLTAFAHQDVPFERVVEHLHPERDLSRTPVFQVMLNGQDTPKHDVRWPGVEVTGEPPEPGVSKYDLTLDLHRVESGLVLDLEFNRDVLEVVSARRLLARVAVALTWLADHPTATDVSDVDVLPADELEWLRAAGAGVVLPDGIAAGPVDASVLDERGRPLPAGVVGALHVGDEPRDTGVLARFDHDGTVSIVERPPDTRRIAPPVDPATAAADEIAPRDDLEALVLRHMRRVLDKPRLGVTDDFFDHGGSSMSAMTLLLDLQAETGLRLDVRDLFQDSTAASIAARLREPTEPITESELGR
jgi:hypothetical protein